MNYNRIDCFTPVVLDHENQKQLTCGWLGKIATLSLSSGVVKQYQVENWNHNGQIVVSAGFKNVPAWSTAKKVALYIFTFCIFPLVMLIALAIYRTKNKFVLLKSDDSDKPHPPPINVPSPIKLPSPQKVTTPEESEKPKEAEKKEAEEFNRKFTRPTVGTHPDAEKYWLQLKQEGYESEVIRKLLDEIGSQPTLITNMIRLIPPNKGGLRHQAIFHALKEKNEELYWQVLTYFCASSEYYLGLPAVFNDPANEETDEVFAKLKDALVNFIKIEAKEKDKRDNIPCSSISNISGALTFLYFKRYEMAYADLFKSSTDEINYYKDYRTKNRIQILDDAFSSLFSYFATVCTNAEDIAHFCLGAYENMEVEHFLRRVPETISGQRILAFNKYMPDYFKMVLQLYDNWFEVIMKEIPREQQANIQAAINNQVRHYKYPNIFYSIYTFKNKLWENIPPTDQQVKLTYAKAINNIPKYSGFLGLFLHQFVPEENIENALELLGFKQALQDNAEMPDATRKIVLNCIYLGFPKEWQSRFCPKFVLFE